jgi:hypothetical protein
MHHDSVHRLTRKQLCLYVRRFISSSFLHNSIIFHVAGPERLVHAVLADDACCCSATYRRYSLLLVVLSFFVCDFCFIQLFLRFAFDECSELILNFVSPTLCFTASHWSFLPVSHRILGLSVSLLKRTLHSRTSYFAARLMLLNKPRHVSCDLHVGHSVNFSSLCKPHFGHSRCRLEDSPCDTPMCHVQK